MTENTISMNTRLAPALIDDDAVTQVAIASQWRLMWWKFRKHRLAMISLTIVACMYTIALFAGFFAPYDKATYNRHYTQAPPQKIR